ncbi:MAG TPA: hypothetical protein VFL64_22050 [Rhizobacter sp.]|nr:hypothetical protein [Rhizobacter sp.]
MMWHWNSLWAPAPGDPPAIDDPKLWRSPWSAEQVIALQARSWEAALAASHSWWSMLLPAFPIVPSWTDPGWVVPKAEPAANVGIEPLAAKPVEAPRKATAPRKRSAAPTRHSVQARKR